MSKIKSNFLQFYYLKVNYYEGRSINKLQNGATPLILKIGKIRDIRFIGIAFCDFVSGAESERKTELSGGGAVSRRAKKKRWSVSGSRSGSVIERERSGKRIKLAAQIALKSEATEIS